MSDPTIPPMPEPMLSFPESGKVTGYYTEDPATPRAKLHFFTTSQMRSMYLQGWRDRGEVDAKACEDRAADVRKANTRGARVSSATLFVVDQLEFAASVIRSIPEPKEG